MRCPSAGRSLLLVELERRAGHAITFARPLRPVGKNVSEMAAAFRAVHLGAGHEETGVARAPDRARHRLPERRPARAAFILGRRVEQRLAAAGAAEGARTLFVVQRAAERALRAVIAQHVMLQRIEVLLSLRGA